MGQAVREQERERRRADRTAHRQALRRVPGHRWKRTVSGLLLAGAAVLLVFAIVFITTAPYLAGVAGGLVALSSLIMIHLNSQAEKCVTPLPQPVDRAPGPGTEAV